MDLLNRTPYCFAADPLRVDCAKGNVLVSYAGQPVYRAKLDAPATVDFSDLAQCCVEPLPDPMPSGYVIDNVEHCNVGRRFKVTQSGRDLFSRLLLPGCTPSGGVPDFLSARVWRGSLRLRPSELGPLYGIADGERIVCGGKQFNLPSPGSIYAIDLRQLYESNGPHFAIADGSLRVDIEVLRQRPAIDRYILRFRNCFGCYDRIELTGEAKITPSYPSDGDYLAYVDGQAQRRRLPHSPSSMTVTVGSGPKEGWEMELLMAALASDETWLESIAPKPLRVLPSAKNFSLLHALAAPQQAELEFITATDIRAFVPDGRGRIHSSQFTAQFN